MCPVLRVVVVLLVVVLLVVCQCLPMLRQGVGVVVWEGLGKGG